MLSNDVRILRGAALVAGPVGIAAAAASTVLAGVHGLIGSVVGVVVVFLFFGLGLVVLARLTRDHPQLMMIAGLAVYTVQLLLLGIFIAVFKDTTLFSGRSFAFTLLATTLAWLAGQIRWFLRAKMLYVEPVPSASGPPAGEAGNRE